MDATVVIALCQTYLLSETTGFHSIASKALPCLYTTHYTIIWQLLNNSPRTALPGHISQVASLSYNNSQAKSPFYFLEITKGNCMLFYHLFASGVGKAFFSEKDRIGNSLCFVSHLVSAAVILAVMKAAIDNMQINEHCRVPIKLFMETNMNFI